MLRAAVRISDIMSRLGREHGLDIHVMHEDVFDSMYHV